MKRIRGERELRGVRTRARQQMFVDDFLRAVLASAAASTDGQTALHVEERTSAAIHAFADLAVGHGMADTDVHMASSIPATGAQAASIVAPILIANKNDCQLRICLISRARATRGEPSSGPPGAPEGPFTTMTYESLVPAAGGGNALAAPVGTPSFRTPWEGRRGFQAQQRE